MLQVGSRTTGQAHVAIARDKTGVCDLWPGHWITLGYGRLDTTRTGYGRLDTTRIGCR